MLNRFLIISKSLNFAAHLLKWPSKNKDPTRARAKSQLNLLKVTVTINFFQNGNCNFVTCLLSNYNSVTFTK